MATSKTKINVPLLRKVQACIRRYPKRFDMDTFYGVVGKDDPYGGQSSSRFLDAVQKQKGRTKDAITCGTAACIAGWTVVCANIRVTEPAILFSFEDVA